MQETACTASSDIRPARLTDSVAQLWDGRDEFVTIAVPPYQGDDVQRVKKIVLWTLLAFFVYAIVTSPAQAADIARNLWDVMVQGLTSIGSFFDAILSKK